MNALACPYPPSYQTLRHAAQQLRYFTWQESATQPPQIRAHFAYHDQADLQTLLQLLHLHNKGASHWPQQALSVIAEAGRLTLSAKAEAHTIAAIQQAEQAYQQLALDIRLIHPWTPLRPLFSGATAN
ncbi:hypothetical protein V6U78_03305 [Marinospirillum sp. MEB164]|uniref:Uncharacterized protein n=1 Tax=Marinospirillum alkalitolerans TaxID=3123374 RepID=A0ABW8PUV6_9GAMM